MAVGEVQLENTTGSGLTRPGGAATVPPSASAIDSMYRGHSKSVAFSSHFTNVWASPNQMMYEDGRLSATRIKQEREARILMHNLERQLKKVEDMKEKKLKE